MIHLYPIGLVRYWAEGELKGVYPEDTVQIQIYDRFSAGLKGVEKADSLWILYWMHKLSEEDRRILQVHPMGDRTREKQGVFVLRSPVRPNPIGLTRVKLIERKGHLLIVKGLDAFDETPVLDIKSALGIS